MPVSNNAIHVIQPYLQDGTWYFDDADRHIRREPFVLGSSEVLSMLVLRWRPGAHDRVRVAFSAKELPGAEKFERQEKDGDGYWYTWNGERFWLCGVTRLYFNGVHPKEIYVTVLGEAYGSRSEKACPNVQ